MITETPLVSRGLPSPPRPDARAAGRPDWSAAAWASLAAAPVAASTLVYAGFYVGYRFLIVLLGAAVVAVPFAVLAGTRRWRADASLAIAVLAGSAYLCYALARPDLEFGLPGWPALTSVFSSVAHGWGRMLSVALPASASPQVLALPAAVTWAASFAAVTIALRRTRWRLRTLAPGAVVFTLAVLCTASRLGAQLGASAAFLAACALVLAGRAPVGQPQPRAAAGRVQDGGADERRETVPQGGLPSAVQNLRAITAVAVCIAVVAVASVAGAAWIPSNTAHRLDPQRLDPPPVSVNQAVTPLAAVDSQLRGPAQPVATVTLSGLGVSAVDRIRLAALDDYDGSAWTSSDRYLLASQELAAEPGLRETLAVIAQVNLNPGNGPYLPEIGWPTGITWQTPTPPPETGFDQGSGILVAAAGAGDSGRRAYTLRAEVVSHTGLSGAVPASDPADASLPVPLPAALVRVARDVSEGRNTRYAELAALQSYFLRIPYSVNATPGHSYGRLVQLVEGTPAAAADGSSEQQAAAFAVVARYLGFPARVATGYRLTGGRRLAGGGTFFQVTTSDAEAWPEVLFQGYGWVPFDPTNPAYTRVVSPNVPDLPQPRDSKPPPLPQAVPSGPGRQRSGRGPLGDGLPAVVTDGLYALAALAALAAAGFAAVAAEKARRYLRRRRAPVPAARLTGAWHAVRDRLVERGLELPPSMSADDVAASATARFRSPVGAVAQLAALVSAAVFTPDEPTPAQADQAWQLYEQVLRGLYPHRFTPRRVIALFRPRVLLLRYQQDRPAHRYSVRQL